LLQLLQLLMLLLLLLCIALPHVLVNAPARSVKSPHSLARSRATCLQRLFQVSIIVSGMLILYFSVSMLVQSHARETVAAPVSTMTLANPLGRTGRFPRSFSSAVAHHCEAHPP
jgi:hypothetical protein